MGPSVFILVWSLLGSVSYGADKSFVLPAYRNTRDARSLDGLSEFRKRGEGEFSDNIGKALYFSAEFTVGDSQLSLPLDTGSSDLYVDPGLYL